MSRFLLPGGFASLAVCVAVGATRAGPSDDDTKAIQGAWVVTDHKPESEPKAVYVKAVFKGDKLTLYSELAGKNNEIECTFKLDATVTPKRIDFAPVTGANKGQTYSGLYEFKGGELRICYRGPRSTRPKDFNDEGDGKFATTFLVLKRKPGA